MTRQDWTEVPPWADIDIPAASEPHEVTDRLHAIVKQLDVENAPRYRASKTATYCNIFVTDICRAWGVAPHHWCHPITGQPTERGVGHELSANKMCAWFKSFGAAHHWVEADKKTATDAARRGHLVVLTWRNPEPKKSGHVAVLLPEGTIAQAGRRNFVGQTVAQGFGQAQPTFWVQMRHGSHAK